MLWYKNWLETRSRVVFNLIMWTGFITFLFYFVVKHDPIDSKFDYEMMSFLAAFSLSTFVSLAGSGVRTQAGHLRMMPDTRSTVYTLSLPVGRCRLLLMRSALGLLEAAALTVVYAILVWILYLFEKTTRDFTGPLVLIVFCGVWIYSVASLLSTFLNEAIYIWIIWLLVFLYFIFAVGGWMPAFLNVFAAMRQPTGTGSSPWLQAASFLVLAGIFLFASIKVVESQEYAQ